MKTETLKAIIQMMPCAYGDPDRYNIMGVYLEQSGDKTKLVATNGHLVVERLMDDQIPEGKYMAFPGDLPILRIILKEHKVVHEIKTESDKCCGLIVGLTTRVTLSKYEGDYPNYDAVIPKHSELVAITLNPKYILAVAKAIENGTNQDSSGIRIEFNPLNPFGAAIIGNGQRDDFRACVMPMRDDRTKAICDARKEKEEASA